VGWGVPGERVGSRAGIKLGALRRVVRDGVGREVRGVLARLEREGRAGEDEDEDEGGYGYGTETDVSMGSESGEEEEEEQDKEQV
jgi:hypothetical protein